MKIRNGFVSNSSSSSFVVFFPTEEGAKVRENLNENAKCVFDLFVKPTGKKIGGVSISSFEKLEGNAADNSYDIERDQFSDFLKSSNEEIDEDDFCDYMHEAFNDSLSEVAKTLSKQESSLVSTTEW